MTSKKKATRGRKTQRNSSEKQSVNVQQDVTGGAELDDQPMKRGSGGNGGLSRRRGGWTNKGCRNSVPTGTEKSKLLWVI